MKPQTVEPLSEAMDLTVCSALHLTYCVVPDSCTFLDSCTVPDSWMMSDYWTLLDSSTAPDSCTVPDSCMLPYSCTCQILALCRNVTLHPTYSMLPASMHCTWLSVFYYPFPGVNILWLWLPLIIPTRNSLDSLLSLSELKQSRLCSWGTVKVWKTVTSSTRPVSTL